jgi:protein-S-isoprenylcysteine O-methyltransferase Ste14
VFHRREEGVALSVLLGVSYVAYCGGIVAYLLEPVSIAWGSIVFLPEWVRWTGVIPLTAGAAMIAWGFSTLGRHFAFSVSPQAQGDLIRSGPYRWVRHPLYTAFLVEAVGISLLMASWFVALTALLVWGLLVCRTRIEEEKLVERFGNEYREYMAMTGRFVPDFTAAARNTAPR